MPNDPWTPTSGAITTSGGVRFELWAPNAATVDVVLDDRSVPMDTSTDGRFSVTVAELGAGARYRFRLDGADAYPDPYSRYQPEGVHGPSEVIDPQSFSWTDAEWTGIGREGQVIYELHIGTMTPEGTFDAMNAQLDALRVLGVTVIELMPVAQCPGERNWGYDGVGLFAPYNAYGRPDDLRRFVDAAHAHGLAVLLDVVYNHLGPEGNYLRAFADAYFTDRHVTPWGDGLNWDGEDRRWVRQFAIENACYWIHDFHFDGLRLDATHAMNDGSPEHIVAELSRRAREAAGDRSIVIYAEDGLHEITKTRSVEDGGGGIDGIWADDFHHEVRVLLTNARENYYSAYSGATTAIAEAINDGLEQSFEAEAHPVGSKIEQRDVAAAFVTCIQNHDQVGNRPFGERLHHEVNLDRYLVASTLLLFAPETPLLFMGQEFAASSPFLFFTDHPEGLGRLVTDGRRREFAGFRAFGDEHLRDSIPDPQARSTFVDSKLDLDERQTNAGVLNLYRTLISLRRTDPVMKTNDRSRTRAHAVTAQLLTVHRWTGAGHRLLIANFGSATSVSADYFREELSDAGPSLALTTSAADYDGTPGEPSWNASDGFTIAARCATIWSW